jgi:hypothetical protein
MAKKNKQNANHHIEDEKFPLPVDTGKDDIYNREKKLPLNDEEIPQEVISFDNDDGPGDDLDIPGAELDDNDEAIGEEDEENNYYSLGGDNHENLEENNG